MPAITSHTDHPRPGLQLHTHHFPSGLTLVAEHIPEVRGVSFQILTPISVITDPDEALGLSGVLEILSYRGSGSLDARALSDVLDALGVQRGGGADLEATSYAASLLADDLDDALAVYAGIVRNPALPSDQLDAARSLAIQRIESVKDNPTQQLFIALSAAYFPGVYGRSPLGTRAGINSITPDLARRSHARRSTPDGAIIAVAGRFNWEALVARVQELFGDWSGEQQPVLEPETLQRTGYQHINADSAQEQIGVAWPDVTAEDPGFYASRMAIQVLSGGSAARLFTEVREKRGLVYNVAAFPRTVRGAGLVVAYAGTTPERRQECLDVLLQELGRLPEGITEEELSRARTGLLSSLIMQGESCTARAGAIARDQFMLGRVRSLSETRAGIEAVSIGAVLEHLDAHPPARFTIVTLGPEPVEAPVRLLASAQEEISA